MANKKISELTSATPSANSVIPSSDSAGTVTNKVTLQSILDLETRWDIFKPSAPTNLSGTAGNSQVSLTWTAPSVLTQTPITDYVVQYSSDNGLTWNTFNDGTSSSTGATVTGLTNGTSYKFRVAAVNTIGQGSWSSESSSIVPGGDPYFANVELLLHMDGSNGSSSFIDSSSNNITTSSSGATISTSQSKWGGSSLYMDGNNGYVSVPTANIGIGGSDDFVIELWFNASVTRETSLFSLDDGSSKCRITVIPSSGLIAVQDCSNSEWNTSGLSISTNVWHHIAISRSSGTLRVYYNGTAVITESNHTGTFFSCGNGTLRIGHASWYSPWGFSGYIDDFRITIGSSRGYTGSTINIPAAPFPNS